MALATTCPHCKTSFKVVADQLKLRRGLVRCGKCQEVFSGVDYLRYIDEPKPKTPAPTTETAPDLEDLKTAFFLPETIFNASLHVDSMTIQAPVPAYIPSPLAAPSAGARPEAPSVGPDRAQSQAAAQSRSIFESPEVKATPRDNDVAQKISSESDLRAAFFGADAQAQAPSSATSAIAKVAASPDPPKYLDPPETLAAYPLSAVEAAALKLSRIPQGLEIEPNPEELEPRVRVNSLTMDSEDQGIASHGEVPAIDYAARPRARSKLLMALCVLLVFGALLQGAILARNELAIQYPGLRVLLSTLCEPFGLKVELPRRFEALTIESFELQAGESSGSDNQIFVAQALLRNQANHAVQWPAIELSLTDPSGQLLARKVLLSNDYLGALDQKDAGFPARSEKNIRVRLSLNQLIPNGYSAVLFYP
jgi:predicted Zn finger-like uncharacterized protein